MGGTKCGDGTQDTSVCTMGGTQVIVHGCATQVCYSRLDICSCHRLLDIFS